MPTRAFIQTYNIASASARELRNAFDRMTDPRIRPFIRERGNFPIRLTQREPEPEKTIGINWGYSDFYDRSLQRVQPQVNRMLLNRRTSRATNKSLFFRTIQGSIATAYRPNVPLVAYNYENAVALMNAGHVRKMVERHTLEGHSGAGIRIVTAVNNLSRDAALYVKYIPKESEWRVHICTGHNDATSTYEPAFLFQKKLLRRSAAEEARQANGEVNQSIFDVRNYQNGWVYTTQNVDPPRAVILLADKLAAAMRHFDFLNFAAFDIIYNRSTDTAYVLEANTAPGIESVTADFYARQVARLSALHSLNNRSVERFGNECLAV